MTATPATPRPMYRSTRDSKLGGVCGGIAEYMGWDPNAVRLAAALSILLPGPQVIAYLIAWIVLPTDQQVAATPPALTPPPAMPQPPVGPRAA
jgi:phage shock protein C